MIQGIKNTVKSSIIYGLGNISTKLVGIVLLPLFTDTSLLSVDEFGVLGVVDVTIQVLVAMLGLSLYQAFFRWYWDKNHIHQRESIFFTLFVFLSLLAGIILLFGVFASNAISYLLFTNEAYSHVVLLMLVSVGFQIITQLPLSLMRLQERPVLYTVTNISRLVVSLVLTIIFITKLNRGIEGIYEAQIIGNLFFFMLTGRYISIASKAILNLQVIKEMLRYSIPLTIASVSGILLATLDRYVLNYKASLLDVGIYTLAFRIANTIRVFVIHSIQLAVAPTIFKLMNHPNNKAIYARIMTYFALLIIYSSLVLSVFGFEIIEIFASDKIYFDSYKLIPILCLGLLLGNIKDVAINGLNIVKKTRIVSIIVPMIVLFHLSLNFILIPILGVYGAAIASAVSQGIYMVVVIYFAQKYYFIPYEYNRIVLPLFVAAILFAIGFNFSVFSLFSSILLKLSLVFTFPVILWYIPFFKADEKQWVLDGVKSLKRYISNI